MADLQIRGIADRLYAALVARASREGRSIREEVVQMLKAHLGCSGRSVQDAKRKNRKSRRRAPGASSAKR
jgi:plasmid stability protein